jgi:hypothetical protein
LNYLSFIEAVSVSLVLVDISVFSVSAACDIRSPVPVAPFRFVSPGNAMVTVTAMPIPVAARSAAAWLLGSRVRILLICNF